MTGGDDLQAHCDRLERRNAENQAEIRQLRTHLAERYRQALTNAQRLFRSRHELGGTKHELALERLGHQQARAALDDTGRRLHQIETSTIWQLTRPLRALGARAPGPARLAGRAFRLLYWALTLQLGARYRAWRTHRGRAVAAPAIVPPPAPEPAHAAPLAMALSDVPVVSVLLGTAAGPAATLATLRSIAAHQPACPIEIILLGDGGDASPDLSRARLFELTDAAGIRRSSDGAIPAAAAARGRHLYLLDGGAELREGALDALVDLLDRRADAGAAGSKLIDADGLLQEAGGIVWSDGTRSPFGRGEDPARPEFNYVRDIDYGPAASLLIRRTAWEQVGGFDAAGMPASDAEVDLAFRLRASGHRVLYEPRSLVVCVPRPASAERKSVVERWGDRLRAEHYEPGTHLLRARDRARTRPVLLAIDHFTLEPDQDAGSRSVLGILDAAAAAGWVVKFWPHNQAYHPYYTPLLEAAGIETIDQRRGEEFASWLRLEGGALDHVLVVRPEIAADMVGSLLRETDAQLSFYGVDLHFARMRRQAAMAGDPALHAASERMERLERRLWRLFDVVIYPSEEEAALVRQMAPGLDVHGIVPFAFETLPPRTSVPPAADETAMILFVAGFAHNPNVDAAEFLVAQVMPLVERAFGPVELILAGSNPTEAVRALAGPRVRVTGFVTDDELDQFYRSARVAVVPLRFGAGVKGKVIEAMSRGLPLVTTSIGAQGIDGLATIVPVHDDAASIATAVVRLLRDDAAWLAQSQAQSAFAERDYSAAAMHRSVLAAFASGAAAR